MKITIETTASEPQHSQKAIVEVLYDDVGLVDMRVLFDQALRGFGFHWNDDDDEAEIVK